MQDLQYAVRTLKAQPGFVVISAITIGVGIGINGGIFSILNSLASSACANAGSRCACEYVRAREQ